MPPDAKKPVEPPIEPPIESSAESSAESKPGQAYTQHLGAHLQGLFPLAWPEMDRQAFLENRWRFVATPAPYHTDSAHTDSAHPAENGGLAKPWRVGVESGLAFQGGVVGQTAVVECLCPPYALLMDSLETLLTQMGMGLRMFARVEMHTRRDHGGALLDMRLLLPPLEAQANPRPPNPRPPDPGPPDPGPQTTRAATPGATNGPTKGGPTTGAAPSGTASSGMGQSSCGPLFLEGGRVASPPVPPPPEGWQAQTHLILLPETRHADQTQALAAQLEALLAELSVVTTHHRAMRQAMLALAHEFQSQDVKAPQTPAPSGSSMGSSMGANVEHAEALRWLSQYFVVLGYLPFEAPPGQAPQPQLAGGLGWMAPQSLGSENRALGGQVGNPGPRGAWAGVLANKAHAMLAAFVRRMGAHHTLPHEGQGKGQEQGPGESGPTAPPHFLVVEETQMTTGVHRRDKVSMVMALGGEKPAPPGKSVLPRQGAAWVGLFSHRAAWENVWDIPLVRTKLAWVHGQMAAILDAARHKQLEALWHALPRYELFRMPPWALEALGRYVLANPGLTHPQPLGLSGEIPGAYRLVVGSGTSFTPERLTELTRALERHFNQTAESRVAVDAGGAHLAMVEFYRPPGTGAQGQAGTGAQGQVWPPPLDGELLAVVASARQTRFERLMEWWLEGSGAPEQAWLAQMILEGLPQEYLVAHTDMEVVMDLARLVGVLASGEAQVVLGRPQQHGHGPQQEGAGAGSSPRSDAMRLAFYSANPHPLSKLMPVLANLGLRVEEEQSHPVATPNGTLHVYVFRVEPGPGLALSPDVHEAPLRQLLLGILAGQMESDPLNALLLACRADWREAALLAAYREYLTQTGTPLTRRTVNETLPRRAQATRALLELFHARFDPESGESTRAEVIQAAEAALSQAMAHIDNLTEDRVFKRLANLVRATLRTNYYQNPQDTVLAFKLSSRLVEGLPLPLPWVEIFVQAPNLLGIHLRGGAVARGGIRYSDRPDDFRVEILSLMATQVKKNAIIVPTGAKGGFVVKSTAAYGQDAKAAGDAEYRRFIGALLSLTDNHLGNAVQPPPRTVRWDGDDPYLVVAADKGTAHLSDTANQIALEHGFWLGDAFASGGSHGYDHKKVAITARGAWQSARRHFWELGADPQTQPLTVVGIGDMSGDVFGNLMLQSRAIGLVGAFDHRHVFLDPAPDPELSATERARLFALPRSSWADYDPMKISVGGGVWPRSAKAIPLSPQAQALLGITEAQASGEAVIRALLCAQVDLLANGGIGTYIKAAGETHAEVSDHANDAVRVNAKDVRARVIVEGGNLGMTPLARLEADHQGVRLYTDAQDNSGGVHLSDYEVNLKILLSGLMAQGHLGGMDARNQLLARLQDQVAALVVDANRAQTLRLALDARAAAKDPAPFVHLLTELVERGILDRRTEPMPSWALMQSPKGTPGMARPWLSVLAAHAKMALRADLRGSTLLDQPELWPFFAGYFPASLVAQYPHLGQPPGSNPAPAHPLAREIIATALTNHLMDTGGMCAVAHLAHQTGRTWPHAAQALLLAEAVTDAAPLRKALHALDYQTPAAVLLPALEHLENGVALLARKWLAGEVPAFAAAGDLAQSLKKHVARQAAPAPNPASVPWPGLPEEVAKPLDRVSHWATFPV